MTRFGNERGAIFLDVMIASTIFLAVVVELARSTMSARRATTTGRDETEAATLAFDKLEELRVKELDHADLAPGDHVDPANPMRADGAGGGMHSRRWRITDALPIDGMRKVEMHVDWRGEGGAQKRVTLVSFVGDLR